MNGLIQVSVVDLSALSLSSVTPDWEDGPWIQESDRLYELTHSCDGLTVNYLSWSKGVYLLTRFVPEVPHA